MTFVDTNVFMYAVGRQHPLRRESRAFFEQAFKKSETLFTSAEVLQELLHAYLPVGRIETLEAALALAESTTQSVWPIEAEDVRFGRLLMKRHPGLGARDLLHLACCKRRRVSAIKTFDQALESAFRKS